MSKEKSKERGDSFLLQTSVTEFTFKGNYRLPSIIPVMGN